MAYGDALEGKWRGNWRMVLVASTLHTTSEHGVSSVTTTDAHTSAASSRLNWRPRRFKWIRPFRRKTKSGFCACAITFQTQSTICGEGGQLKPCCQDYTFEGSGCMLESRDKTDVRTVKWQPVASRDSSVHFLNLGFISGWVVSAKVVPLSCRGKRLVGPQRRPGAFRRKKKKVLVPAGITSVLSASVGFGI